jgi:23S rRNA G2069 N7-methylase RlmK/C1962 C5-methylase RlmI
MVNEQNKSHLSQRSERGREWQKQSGLFADFEVTESEVLFSLQRACHQWTVRNMNRRARLAKLKRLKNRHSPRVLDLFAGCGGFSLGFAAAGYEIAGAVEVDPLSCPLSRSLYPQMHELLNPDYLKTHLRWCSRLLCKGWNLAG